MSQIVGIYKSSTKSIFKISKELDFFDQISKVFKEIGFAAVSSSLTEELKVDAFDDLSEKGLDITVVYGKDVIFVIASAKNLDKFNDAMHKRFL